MKRPKAPPSAKPMTPDMAVFPAQDSAAAVIYGIVSMASQRREWNCAHHLDHLLFLHLLGVGWLLVAHYAYGHCACTNSRDVHYGG